MEPIMHACVSADRDEGYTDDRYGHADALDGSQGIAVSILVAAG
ncbi:hypothetical protein GCM10009736_05220 [Actinomadura bangladeshensis]